MILLVLLLFSSTSRFSINCGFYWNVSVCAKSLSRVRLFATQWTAACQAPLSMGYFRKEYWSELHFLLQGIFLTQGSNMRLFCLLHWQVGSLLLGPMLLTWMSWILCNPMGSSLQGHLSLEFSRQEYWSGLPCPLPRDLPNPGTKPRSLALQADSSLSEPPGKPFLHIATLMCSMNNRLHIQASPLPLHCWARLTAERRIDLFPP